MNKYIIYCIQINTEIMSMDQMKVDSFESINRYGSSDYVCKYF